MGNWKHAQLGKTGRNVGRLGLASGYGADERCVREAFEQGVNYLYWGSFRNASFGAGLRGLKQRRDDLVLVIQSYTRLASMMAWSLERALRRLEMDYTDVLLLGMWNKDVPSKIMDAARQLRERGLVKHLAVSTHNRAQAVKFANNPDIEVIHVRYNALHPGAERDIFPQLKHQDERPGFVSFTATSWGQLLSPKNVPAGERVPTAADCYRYVLSNPSVDVCLTGPKTREQFTTALESWEKGPMSDEELAWMRRVGKAKYDKLGSFLKRD